MRVRRLALLGVIVGALAAAAPAQGINDPRVPGDNCSPDNSSAVGDPFGGVNPGIDFNSATGTDVTAVDRAVSVFGQPGEPPGAATGALGQLNSNAIGTCPNSLP